MTGLPAKPLYYSLKDIEALTGFDSDRLYRQVRKGLLPTVTLPGEKRGTLMVPREAVERLIGELRADTDHSVVPVAFGRKRRRQRAG